MKDLVGYQLEWRPADYTYCLFEDIQKDAYKFGARVSCLFRTPQPGCDPEPVVYKGRFWCEAKHRGYNKHHDEDAIPLYVGPVIHEPGVDEVT